MDHMKDTKQGFGLRNLIIVASNLHELEDNPATLCEAVLV